MGLALVALLISAESSAFADEAGGSTGTSPINLALFDPVQIIPRGKSIEGFRFNLIYGRNANMTGFDLGLVNFSDGKMVGVQFGAFGWDKGDVTGWQYNFLGNITGGKATGLQMGFLNLTDEALGVQWGAVNIAEAPTGLQFSVVNVANDLKGLQLGLVNVAKNGFLPIFIIFNFNFKD